MFVVDSVDKVVVYIIIIIIIIKLIGRPLQGLSGAVQ